VIVATVAAVADLRSAIGFSSFAVLVYYAVTNAAAWTLRQDERRWPRALAGFGLLGCLTLATTLPLASVAGGAGLLALGATAYLLRRPS
jgi:basic amino acid/polyamine antiporter, APA family